MAVTEHHEVPQQESLCAAMVAELSDSCIKSKTTVGEEVG